MAGGSDGPLNLTILANEGPRVRKPVSICGGWHSRIHNGRCYGWVSTSQTRPAVAIRWRALMHGRDPFRLVSVGLFEVYGIKRHNKVERVLLFDGRLGAP